MAEKKEKKEAPNAENESKGRSKFKLIIIFMMVIVLGAGGFLGWSFFMKKDNNSKEAEAEPKIEKELVRIPFPMKSFIVNLMDSSGSGRRYLKVTMELETSSEEYKTMLEKHLSQLRDTIIMILSSMSFSDINTMEGKLELKKMLMMKINQVMGENIVTNIYFTEFVVQ